MARSRLVGESVTKELFYIDHYGDGDWYDAEYVHIRGDVSYYERVAQETHGPLLELACGTGRLTFPMAQTGTAVHGIDISAAMISRAQAKRAQLPQHEREAITFQRADMRTAELGRKFGAVVLAFNTLMHMTNDDDLMDTLDTARRHLAPEGVFHLDLHTPLPEIYEGRDPDGRYDPEEMIDPRDGQRYIVTENNTYEPRRQINRMRFYYQAVDRDGRDIGVERCAELELRVLFPRELDLFMRLAGFDIVGDWSDFDREESFDGGGGRRVIQAQALPGTPTIVLP